MFLALLKVLATNFICFHEKKYEDRMSSNFKEPGTHKASVQ